MKTEDKMIPAIFRDSLTGIYNRKGFYHETEKLIKSNTDKNYCIVYWNVKRFKIINELFGRKAGDTILKRMARMIEEPFEGKEGTYGRLERDNFVLCFETKLINDESFVRQGVITYVSEGTEYHFASSYGLYMIEDREMDVASMVDKSRIAMEAVKDNYMKPYAYYDNSMRESIVMEQILMSDCERAIKENQFEVYYQPVCNSSDGTIISAEALVRWVHPERGMISPGIFIPTFEKNGFISILDRHVWDKVCRMLKRRITQEKEIVPISMNVSRVDFYNQSLCEDIIEIVGRHGIKPEMIRLEITESAYSINPNSVLDAVKKLRDYGFTILIDDFGSGYSSLNTLKDLPVDILKIDMKFMDDLENGGKSAIILESIIRMTKWMNLPTIAEGVETIEELNFLRNVECDYIQGYYFYKPVRETEFEQLLDNPELVDIKSAAVREYDEKDFSFFYNESMKAESIFQNMEGALGMYELKDGRLEILRVNRRYYEIMKAGSGSMVSQGRLVSTYLQKTDFNQLLSKCEEAEKLGDTGQIQLRRKRYDGVTIWLDVRIRFLGNKGKRKLYYFYIMDITRLKEAEQEQLNNGYCKALFRVFDKVYRLDYDTGCMEVLHSAEEDMKAGDKLYFLDFFDRFRDGIVDNKREEYSEAIKSRETLDEILSRSRTGGISIEYRVNSQACDFEWVSATFFKIEAADGREDYLACIKRI